MNVDVESRKVKCFLGAFVVHGCALTLIFSITTDETTET